MIAAASAMTVAVVCLGYDYGYRSAPGPVIVPYPTYTFRLDTPLVQRQP